MTFQVILNEMKYLRIHTVIIHITFFLSKSVHKSKTDFIPDKGIINLPAQLMCLVKSILEKISKI